MVLHVPFTIDWKSIHPFMSTRSNGWVSHSTVYASHWEYFITCSAVWRTHSNGWAICNPFRSHAFYLLNGKPLVYIFPWKITFCNFESYLHINQICNQMQCYFCFLSFIIFFCWFAKGYYKHVQGTPTRASYCCWWRWHYKGLLSNKNKWRG